jgi:hypothetical protein
MIKRISTLFSLFSALVLFALCASAQCYGQDRDLEAGSTTGSVRPDIAGREAARSRMATAAERAKFIGEEFQECRNLAATINTTTPHLRRDYEASLNRFLAVPNRGRPGEGLLTPKDYFTMRVVQHYYNQTYSNITAESLAVAKMNGKSRRQALVSLGMSDEVAAEAIKRSGRVIKETCKK